MVQFAGLSDTGCRVRPMGADHEHRQESVVAHRITTVLLATSVVAALGMTTLVPTATAAPKSLELPAPGPVSAEAVYLGEVDLMPEQQDYFDNVVAIGAEFEYDEEGKLTLPTSDASLLDQGFSREEIRLLRESIAGAGNHVGAVAPDRTQYLPAPNVHVSNGTLYISNHDLKAGIATGIATAAAIGPAALQAAFIALGTMLGGPAGTIIGITIAIAGAPSMIELAGRVTFALATGQGIYIRPVASYPPMEFGYWR